MSNEPPHNIDVHRQRSHAASTPVSARFGTPQDILAEAYRSTPRSIPTYRSSDRSGVRVRSATPGSRQTPASVRTTRSRTIAAVVEGRGISRGQIGFACIDLNSPECVTSWYTDNAMYTRTLTKLEIHEPREVIFPANEDTEFIPVMRKYFNSERGSELVDHLSVPEYKSVLDHLRGKYYTLSAISGLIKYVEVSTDMHNAIPSNMLNSDWIEYETNQHIQSIVWASKTLKFRYTGSERTTILDVATARNLEIVTNLHSLSERGSLFQAMNQTITICGMRLLRSELLQPPNDASTALLRIMAVEEIVERSDLLDGIAPVLANIVDLDSIISSCIQLPKMDTVGTASSRIQLIILLRHTLQLVESFRSALSECNSKLLCAYEQTLADQRFTQLLDKVDKVTNPNTTYVRGTLPRELQKIFLVKQGLCGYLDVARRTYSEAIEDIQQLCTELANVHDISQLKPHYTASRGWHVRVSLTMKDSSGKRQKLNNIELPGVFVQVARSKNHISATTTDLIHMNSRVQESLTEIYERTDKLLKSLLEDVCENIGCLYALRDVASNVDLLCSNAQVVLADPTSYCKPSFSDTCAIKEGKNPLLFYRSAATCVGNDTYLSEAKPLNIVTGPNMAGKSCYLRQVALLQIMAQLGSYVPAEFACFKMPDQIFTLLCCDDVLNQNSTFMIECTSINYIVQNASENSLILIDELGRGTSPDEAVGMCFAVSEYLLNLRAFTLFVTHFDELNALNMYSSIGFSHFETKQEKEGTRYELTHKIVNGQHQSREHYGLDLARASLLPDSVVNRAEAVYYMLKTAQNESDQLHNPERQQSGVMHLYATKLKQLANNSNHMDLTSMKVLLRKIQIQCKKELEETSHPNQREHI